MNEKFLKDLYELSKGAGYADSFEDFKILMSDNVDAIKDVYSIAARNGYNNSVQDFYELMNPDASKAIPVKVEDKISTVGILEWEDINLPYVAGETLDDELQTQFTTILDEIGITETEYRNMSVDSQKLLLADHNQLFAKLQVQKEELKDAITAIETTAADIKEGAYEEFIGAAGLGVLPTHQREREDHGKYYDESTVPTDLYYLNFDKMKKLGIHMNILTADVVDLGTREKYIKLDNKRIFNQIMEMPEKDFQKIFGKDKNIYNVLKGAIVPEWEIAGPRTGGNKVYKNKPAGMQHGLDEIVKFMELRRGSMEHSGRPSEGLSWLVDRTLTDLLGWVDGLSPQEQEKWNEFGLTGKEGETITIEGHLITKERYDRTIQKARELEEMEQAQDDLRINPFVQTQFVDDKIKEIDVELNKLKDAGHGDANHWVQKLKEEKRVLEKIKQGDRYKKNEEKVIRFTENIQTILGDDFDINTENVVDFITNIDDPLSFGETEAGEFLAEQMDEIGGLLEWNDYLDVFEMGPNKIIELSKKLNLSVVETVEFVEQFELLLGEKVKVLDAELLIDEYYDFTINNRLVHAAEEMGIIFDPTQSNIKVALESNNVTTILNALEKEGFFTGEMFFKKQEHETVPILDDLFNHLGINAYESTGGLSLKRIGNLITITAGGNTLELNTNQSSMEAASAEASKLKDFINQNGDVQHIENLREFGKARSDYATQMQEEDWANYLVAQQELEAEQASQYKIKIDKELEEYNEAASGKIEAAKAELEAWAKETKPTLQLEIDRKVDEIMGKLQADETAFKAALGRSAEHLNEKWANIGLDREAFNMAAEANYYMESRKGDLIAGTVDALMSGVESMVLGAERIVLSIGALGVAGAQTLKYGDYGSNLEGNLGEIDKFIDYQEGFIYDFGPNYKAQNPEFLAEMHENFWGGAFLGVLESLPAMLGSFGIGMAFKSTAKLGKGATKMARLKHAIKKTPERLSKSAPFVSQALHQEFQKMNENPFFDDKTELEKWTVAGPVAMAVGLLEEWGFRSILGKSSGPAITKSVFTVIGEGGSTMTGNQFKKAFMTDIFTKLKTGSLRILKGGLAEFETGSLQEISTTAIEEIYELAQEDSYIIDGKKYSLAGVAELANKDGRGVSKYLEENGIAKHNVFETGLDKGFGSFVNTVFKAGAQEMVGGFMIGTVSALNQGYKEHKFGKIATDIQFKYTEWASQNSNNMKLWKAHLKNELTNGKLDQYSYTQLLNNLEKNASTFREVPKHADLQDRKEAFDLITEKKQLQEQIDKSKSEKNVESVNEQVERLKEVNEKLKVISSYASKNGQRSRVNTPILNKALNKTNLISKKDETIINTIRKTYMGDNGITNKQLKELGFDQRGIESISDAVGALEALSEKYKNSGSKSKQNVAEDIDKMIGFLMNEASSTQNVISIDVGHKTSNGKTQDQIEDLYMANNDVSGDTGETVYFINNKAVSGRVFQNKMGDASFQEELKSGKSSILILGPSLNTRNQYTGKGSVMEQMIAEGAEGVKEIVDATNVAEAVEVFDTSDSMAEALRKKGIKDRSGKNLTGESLEAAIKEAVGSDGFFLDGNEIWINKEMAAKVGAIGVSSHELLHAILKSKIQDANTGLITADGIALIDKFKRKLSKKDLAAIEERIEKFDKYEVIEEEVDGKMVEKIVEKAKEKYYSEYLTYFSDLITLGTSTTQGTNWWKDVGNTLTFNYFKPAGFKNAEFTDAKSVYNFVKSYSEAFKTGKFKEIAQEVAKDKKIDASPTGKTDFSKTVNEKISDLQSQKESIIEDQKKLFKEKGDKALMKENVKSITEINKRIKKLKGELTRSKRKSKRDITSRTKVSAASINIKDETADNKKKRQDKRNTDIQSIYETHAKGKTKEEWREFLETPQGISVRNRMIEMYMPDMLSIAYQKGVENPTDAAYEGIIPLTQHISAFDPSVNNNLANYTGTYLGLKTLTGAKRVQSKGDAKSLEELKEGGREIADTSVSIDKETKPEPTKVLLSTKLGVKKAKVHYKNIVEKAKKLKKKDIPTTYKGTKDLDAKGTVDMFLEDPTSVYQKGKTKGNNIAESITDKLLNNKDLNKQDIEALQPFINKHADALMAGAISEGATPGGKSTGVQNILLAALFTKTQRAKMAKTGSAQGLPIQVKQEISNKFRNKFLSLMGLTPSGKSNIRDIGLSSQTIKAVLAQTGKIMSNQAIREAHPSAKKIGEGKSKIMWSKSVAPTSPIKLTHLNDVVDLSYSDITSQKGYEALSKKGNNGNWNLTKEERFQADMFLRKIAPLLPKNFFNSGNLSHSRALFPNMTYVDKVLNGEMYTREELLKFGIKEDVVDQLMQPVVFNEKMNDQPTRFKYSIKGKFKTHVGSGKNKMTIASYFKSDKFLNNEAKKIPFLKQVFEVIQSDLKTNPENVVFWEALLRDAQNSMGHFVKTMAPLTAYPKNYKNKIREEHSMPQHLVAKYLLNSAINNTLEKDFENIEKHYFQVALKLKDDRKLSDAYGDITGIGYNFDKRMPDFHELGMDTWIRYLNFLVNKNKGGINPNSYELIQEGGTLADKYNLGITTADIQGLGATIRSVITPKVVAYQIKLAEQVIKGEITPKVARNRLMKMLPLAKPMQKAAMNFSKTVNSSGVVQVDPTTMTGEEILSLAMSMDQALAVARDPNAPVKKIRVFDFDDTLARTKSRVIYNKPNTTGKPSSNLKAIVMAGGPGSGKSTVIKGLGLQKQGYKVVNQDISLEWAKKLVGLPAGEADYDSVQRSARSELGALARKIADKKLTQYTNQGTGVILDGTGASLKATKAKVQALKDMGYEVSMIYVETSKETALERNRKRKERSLKDFIVDKTWDSVNANKQDYKNEFGESFFEVNTDNLAQKFQLPTEVIENVNLKLNENIRGRLQPSQFAEVGAQMQEDGATFDFNEFNRVINGKKGPLFEVAEKIQAARGTEDVFVLTARPQEAAGAIHEFLNSVGLKIPIKNITGLESSSPFAKSQWVVEKAAEGYNDFYFADDHLANVEAVQEALDQLDVKSKTQQAKMQFSMTTKRDLKWESWKDDFTKLDEYKTSFKLKGKTYNIKLYQFEKGKYELDFGLGNGGAYDYSLGKVGITKTGNAAEVFSIVSNGVLDFVRNNKANEIQFSAIEPSRSRLYTTLTKFWANKLGWGHEANVLLDGSGYFKIGKNVQDTSFADQKGPTKKVLNVVDRKSKLQRSMEFSKTKEIDSAFNLIIEQKTGIGAKKVFSNAKARVRGKGKGKGKFFIPASHEDFGGLLYKTLAKGKVGDGQWAWYKEVLLQPFARGMNNLANAENALRNDFKALKKILVKEGIPKNLNKKIKDGRLKDYTYQDIIRILAWENQGIEVDGLSKTDLKAIKDLAKEKPELQIFAEQLVEINKGDGYYYPGADWTVGTITTDILDGLNNVKRAKYLAEWQENVDIIFSSKNMNKLQAAFGERYVEALANILTRMRTGKNRTTGKYARIENRLLDYLNNSVGAVMFFNTRSAALQTLSTVNFINWKDNNIIAASKAFANQPQYWKDFIEIMNSDFLVSRRNGLKLNVSESEIADAAAREKNKFRGAMAYMLDKGFMFTKFGDSFAIAAGGATFYRNRINTYLKEGMSEIDAKKQAWDDFRELAEENQQSARPDRISMQQASNIGRVILAFANTPSQYARIMKKSFLDLINGRGDWRANVSRIVYYSTVQNLIFTALQKALFALAFDDEEDEEKKQKYYDTANSMLDNILRGLGWGGALVSMMKNVGIDIYERSDEENQSYKGAEYWKSTFKLFDFSPPMDIKVQKFQRALENWEYNSWRPEVNDPFSIDNPAYKSLALMIASTTNIPLDRLLQKTQNIEAALQEDQETWKRIALVLGWPEWQLETSAQKNTRLKDDRKEKLEMRAETKPNLYTKAEQEDILKQHGYNQAAIDELKNEDDRVNAILKSQEDNNEVYTPSEYKKGKFDSPKDKKEKKEAIEAKEVVEEQSDSDKVYDLKKDEQVRALKNLGVTKKEIDLLRVEGPRVNKILELQEEKGFDLDSLINAQVNYKPTKQEKLYKELESLNKADQIEKLKKGGLSDEDIKKLKYEKDRIEAIMKLKND